MKKQFSLLEIMVVIAIIGILAAMCTPVVIRARAKSQEIKESLAIQRVTPTKLEQEDPDLSQKFSKDRTVVLTSENGSQVIVTSDFKIEIDGKKITISQK